MQHLLAEAPSTGELRGERGRHFDGLPDGVYWHYPVACLAAHPATVLIRFDYLTDPVTQAALRTRRHLLDPAEGCRCMVIDDSLQPACCVTVPEVLKVYLAVPAGDRTAQRRLIRQMVQLVKKYRLHRYVARDSREWMAWAYDATVEQRHEEKAKWLAAGRTEPGQEKPGWLRFSFPHSYNSDLLEVVLLLGEAGAQYDEVIEERLRLILSKPGPGRHVADGWRAERQDARRTEPQGSAEPLDNLRSAACLQAVRAAGGLNHTVGSQWEGRVQGHPPTLPNVGAQASQRGQVSRSPWLPSTSF